MRFYKKRKVKPKMNLPPEPDKPTKIDLRVTTKMSQILQMNTKSFMKKKTRKISTKRVLVLLNITQMTSKTQSRHFQLETQLKDQAGMTNIVRVRQFQATKPSNLLKMKLFLKTTEDQMTRLRVTFSINQFCSMSIKTLSL